MLGLLFSAATLLGIAGDSMKKSTYKEMNRQEAIKNGKSYYLDKNGREFDVETGRQVYHGSNASGDCVLYDMQTFQEIKNLTKEKVQVYHNKYRDIAKDNGKTVYEIYYGVREMEELTGCEGKRFQDVNNGRIYVRRRLDGCRKWYMDTSNGHLVRLTDEEKGLIEREKAKGCERLYWCVPDDLKEQGYKYCFNFYPENARGRVSYDDKIPKYFKSLDEFKEEFNKHQDLIKANTGKIHYYNIKEVRTMF